MRTQEGKPIAVLAASEESYKIFCYANRNRDEIFIWVDEPHKVFGLELKSVEYAPDWRKIKDFEKLEDISLSRVR